MLSVLTLAHGTLAALAVVGLAVRRRLRLGWSFGLYLVAIAIFDMLMGLWPDRFLNWPFWLTYEATYASLKVAMALEFSGLFFRAFPAAGRVGRFGLLGILGGTIIWVAIATPSSLGEWIRVGMPRIKCGEALLLAWLLVVVLWYRIPLHFLHKAVLVVLAPYLLVFTVILQALETYNWTGASDLTYLNMLVFLGVLGSWLYAAWRPDEQAEVHPNVAKVVQPWA